MIRHLVLLRWTDDRSDDDLATMAAALDALPGEISEIRTYEHGRDLALASTNFDYAITATFASADDFARYRDHPVHQRFLADHLAGRAERVAVQFDLSVTDTRG